MEKKHQLNVLQHINFEPVSIEKIFMGIETEKLNLGYSTTETSYNLKNLNVADSI